MRKELLWSALFLLIVAGFVWNAASRYTKVSAPDTFTANQVSKHRNPSDCWLIINNNVYDATAYLSQHPGGEAFIEQFCGQDATTAFATQGGGGSHSTEAQQLLSDLRIGNLSK